MSEQKRKSWKEWFSTGDAIAWVYLVFGFIAILMLMIILQRSTDAICCGDWDGYYHIRWSEILWQSLSSGQGLPEFKWLPLTILDPQNYNDHHFLFHLLQVPFLWFFEPVTAAKVAAVFYATLAVFSVYWLMFYYRIDYLPIWLGALLTCANPFYYRMNMAKAPPLTIIFSIIGIYLLFERKYVWLLPLMFLFTWTYSLFPLLWFAAFVWTLILAWNERVFEWRPLAYTTAGMILGNTIHPFFPNNIKLFVEHLKMKIRMGNYDVPVGGEWYSYQAVEILTHFPIALLAMLVGYILFTPRNGKLPEKATFFLAFVTPLLAAQFVAKRYAEYFPPFAILFAAFSWQAFFVKDFQLLPEDFRKELEAFLDKKKSEKQLFYERIKKVAVALIGMFFFTLIIFNYRGVDLGWIKQEGLIQSISNNEPNDKYRRATEWAKSNIPENEMIFNCNWDDFPKLFFFAPEHRYVYGLDPNYLYSKSPEIYKLVRDIAEGRVDDPGPLIREKLGARYVFSDAGECTDFIAKALDSGWFEIAYEDDEAYYLRIRETKGEPPAIEDSEQTENQTQEEDLEQNEFEEQ
ncbi:MAG: hypothetical protein N2Z23_07155 [Pyrinomonadaceae bacterium]|nr:hypothetical protein [Pyrinomonadaceae bacterium]MCX7640202.1 hypothetical protein [Pyrinomonadaceae bacterium]MDW8303210.1 hypothetical protein [Acidobacteriota bacterium]